MSLVDRLRDVIGDMKIDAFADLINERPTRIKDVLRARQRIPQDILLKLHEQLEVDLNWLIAGTGARPVHHSTSREVELLHNYRKADGEAKFVIEQTAALAARPRAAGNSSRKKPTP